MQIEQVSYLNQFHFNHRTVLRCLLLQNIKKSESLKYEKEDFNMKEEINLNHKERVKVDINGETWYLTEKQYERFKNENKKNKSLE